MPDSTTEQVDEQHVRLEELVHETARGAQEFSSAIRDMATGSAPDAVIPLLLLAVAQLSVTGARLGAIQDVVPAERFEADSGPETDLDALRVSLANVFQGIDDFTDLVDPVTSMEISRGALSEDLTGIVGALEHGLAHYERGRLTEAMWWWQFSYLSEWGVRASAVMRVLQTILGHLRMDVDDETVADAEFDALHP